MDLLTQPLLDVERSAALLGVSKSLVYQFMQQGLLRYVELGRAKRIRPADLEAFAAERMKGGWASPAPPATDPPATTT